MKMTKTTKRKMMNKKLMRQKIKKISRAKSKTRKRTKKKKKNVSKKRKRESRKRRTDSRTSGENSEKTLSWVSLRIPTTDQSLPNSQDGTHPITPLNLPLLTSISLEPSQDRSTSTSSLVRARSNS